MSKMAESIQKISEDYFVFHLEKKRFIEVIGEPVEIEGFVGLDLFIHKSIELYWEGFTLSEGRTGGALRRGESKKEVVESLETSLLKKGIVAFNAMRDEIVEKNGLSPRYIKRDDNEPYEPKK